MNEEYIANGELVLYGPVGARFDDGDGMLSVHVINALATVEGDLTVRLNSGGGSIFEGMAIYNALKRHDGRITVKIDGVAASAASLIAMAGDRIEMPLGATMMIHNPSGVTMGPADEHRKTADVLDLLAGTVAEIYHERTGRSEPELRQMMHDETWMTADDAVRLGFADAEIGDDAADPDMNFDYTSYKNAPAALEQLALNRKATGQPMVAVMSAPKRELEKPKGLTMSNEPKAPAAATQTAKTATTPAKTETPPVDVTREILARCSDANLTLAESNEIIAAADNSIDKARDLIIAKLVRQEDDGTVVTHHATVTADAKDRFRQGVEKALLAKASLDGGEVNEFTSMTLRELARTSMSVAGNKADYSDPMAMIGAALGMPSFTMAGMHSTSDFVEILANVANKSMMKGYQEADETFGLWTSRGILSDFKAHKRIDLNLYPSLSEVPDGAEYKFGTMGDRAETVQLATYGKMFAITRHAIINDDMGAFTRIPLRMGRAARRTIGNLVYAVLTDNAALADGVALFHANHNNLASSGAAPSVITLSAGRVAMKLQKDPDEHATGGLNIRPAYMLVPAELESSSRQLIASEFDPAKSTRIPNPISGMAEVVSESRLSAASTTAWYLAADPQSHDTIEVSFLNGNDQPVLEERAGWNVDGVEMKVRIDAGVKALDFRGLYKDPGT